MYVCVCMCVCACMCVCVCALVKCILGMQHQCIDQYPMSFDQRSGGGGGGGLEVKTSKLLNIPFLGQKKWMSATSPNSWYITNDN